MKAESKKHLDDKGPDKANGRSTGGWAVDKIPAIKLARLKVADQLDEAREDPPKPFPLHCLPPDAQAIAQACVDVHKVPEILAGCCVLGLLSASVGAGLQVRSLADRLTRGNLYILGSSDSGTGKSETFRSVMQPFFEFQDGMLEEWRRDTFPALKAEERALKVETSALESALKGKRGVKPTKEERDDLVSQLAEKEAALIELSLNIKGPTFYVEDTTEQALESRMQQAGETLCCLSDDARQVTDNIMGRNRSNGDAEDGFWVKAWTGGRHKVDRENGRNLTLKNPCLSALLFVQDDKLRAMLARPELTEGGFLPRALICRTGCEPSEIDRSRGRIPLEATQGWHQLVLELLKNFRQSPTPFIIDPATGAATIMDAHFNALVQRRRTGGDLNDVASFAARWTEQAWRISICLHAGLHGRSAPDHELAEDTAECALMLSDWFAEQQLAVLATGRTEKRRSRLGKLQTLLADYGGEVTLRDLARRNGFQEEEVRQLAIEFPSLLTVAKRQTQGRPSEIAMLPKHGVPYMPPPAKPAKPGSRT